MNPLNQAERCAYIERAESQLEHLRTQMTHLDDRVRVVRTGIEKANASARLELAEVEQKIAELTDADAATWTQLTCEIERRWDDLAGSIRSIVSQFA